MDYAALVCHTEDCRSELGEVLEAYRELLEAARALANVEVEIDYSSRPLIRGVRGLGVLLSRLASILRDAGFDIDLEGVRLEDVLEGRSAAHSLLSLIARRLFYDKVKGKLEGVSWSNGRCPVCGMKPVLGVVRREKGEIFSRDVLELRCTCGYSGSYDMLKCPSCGAEGRAAFDYYIAGRVTYRVCRRCGHILGLVSETPVADWDLIAVAVLYGAVRVLESVSQTTELQGSLDYS